MASKNQENLRDRDEELRNIPLLSPDTSLWPKGVRVIGLKELDHLGVDRTGRLYWDGKPIEIKELKLRWPERIIAIFIVLSAIAVAVVNGWEWACKLTWLSAGMCPLN